MKKFSLTVAIGITAIFCLLFTRRATANIIDVEVGPDFAFHPSTVNISVGDTVRWTWAGSGFSVTSGQSCLADGQFCSPNDMNCSSGVLSNTGFVYTHTFMQAGSYPYFSSVHCAGGMTGVVNVSNPVVGVTACIDKGCPPTFTITTGQLVNSNLIVHYTILGPAVFGVDYTISGTFGQVTIPAGQSSATVTLIKIPGYRLERGKTATMWLSALPDYTVNPSQAIATVFVYH